MNQDTRPAGWIRAAPRAFESLPSTVQDRINTGWMIAAEGGKSDTSKPLKGFGPGVTGTAARCRTDTWRCP